MKLIKNIIPSNMYSIKCPYEMVVEGICIHNTANDASAENEIKYMHNNRNEVSFHFAVDDICAIQGLPLNRNAWASGDGGSGVGNRKYIHIEICYSRSGGERFDKAERNCAELVAQMLKERGWGINKVKKHQDFSGKYCPHRSLDLGWQRFLNMIQAELDKLNNPQKPQPISGEMYRIRKTWDDAKSQIGAFSNLENAKKSCKSGYSVFDSKGNKVYPIDVPKPTPTPVQPTKTTGEYIVNEYKENGKFTCTVSSINFRNKPYVGNDNPIQGQYFNGESVNYDYVVVTNKYTWISWVSASSGIRRYMPITQRSNNEKWGYCV